MFAPQTVARKWMDYCWHHLAHSLALKMTHKVTNTSSSPQTKRQLQWVWCVVNHHAIIPITTALLCMMQRVEDFNWLEFISLIKSLS